MSDPRRQKPRIACNVSFQGGGAATNLSGRITDLSGTGLFIVTPQLVAVGKQVHLEFELDGEKIDAVGEVRWVARGPEVEEPGLGVRFLRLSSTSARAIDAALENGGWRGEGPKDAEPASDPEAPAAATTGRR